LTLCRDFAKETVGMGLVAAPRVSAGEYEEAAGKCARLVNAADEAQGLTQLGDRPVDIPLAAVEHTSQEKRPANIVGLLGFLSDPHRVFGHAMPLGEAPQFGEAPGHTDTGDHGRQVAPTEVGRVLLASEQRDCPPCDVERLPKVPPL
jgi:hypothetical protein